MSSGDWMRRALIDKQRITIVGEDPRKRHQDVSEQDQLFEIATYVRNLYDRGWDPINIIRGLLSGAVWFADNCNVSREQLKSVIDLAKPMKHRQLIYDPKGL